MNLKLRRKLTNVVALGLSLAAMAFGLFWLIWILWMVFEQGIGALSFDTQPGIELGQGHHVRGGLHLTIPQP